MPCPNPSVLIQRACSQWWVLTNVRANPELVLETTQKTSRATSVWKRALYLTFNICTSIYEHLVRNPLGWISLFPTCGVDRIRLSINFFFCPECACSIRVCQLGIYWGGYFQIHLSSWTWEHIYFYFMTSTSTKENGGGGGISCADSAHKAAFLTCQATYRFL